MTACRGSGELIPAGCRIGYVDEGKTRITGGATEEADVLGHLKLSNRVVRVVQRG